MVRKKKIKATNILVLLVIALGVVVAFGNVAFGNLGQQGFGEDVYTPNYVSLSCERLPEQVDAEYFIKSFNILTGGSLSVACGVNSGADEVINGYVPFGCKFVPDKFIDYSVVNAGQVCPELSIFTSQWSTLGSNEQWEIDELEKVCLKASAINDGVNVKFSGDFYGLKMNNEDGTVIYEKNCNVREAVDKRSDITYVPGVSDAPDTLTPFSKVQHYIVGASPRVKSKDIITLDGKDVYINGIGSYYPIVTAEDGRKYTNTLNPMQDNRIICIPSANPLCIDGLTYTEDLEGSSCGLFNNIEGYVSIGGNEYCKYECINGENKPFDCKTINPCPANKPILDPNTLECTEAGRNVPDVNTDLSCIPFYQTPSSGDTCDLIDPFCNPEPHCKNVISSWVITAIIVFLLILLIAFLPKSNRNQRPIIVTGGSNN